MNSSTEPKKAKKPVLKLVGTNGNAFALLGLARVAGKKHNFTAEQMTDLTSRAMSGDYSNLLRVIGEYFDIR